MTFDPTKPVQTRDGRKARIICTDAKLSQPIIALITEEDGREYIREFTKNGFYYICEDETQTDLINTPERRVVWLNIYQHCSLGRYDSRTEANSNADASRIGIMTLTYENNKLVDHEYVKLQPTH